MKNKKLHILTTAFLSLSVYFTMTLIFAGCSLDQDLWDAREETRRNAAEQEVKEEQKEEIRAWEENEKNISQDGSEAAEEAGEEGSLPVEPVTYTGDISGIPITLIVDFKTSQVTGSIACPIDGYPDYSVDEGKIDLNTLGITAKSTWIREMHNDEVVQTVEITITGTIDDDLSKIDGEIANDLGESGVFTAYK